MILVLGKNEKGGATMGRAKSETKAVAAEVKEEVVAKQKIITVIGTVDTKGPDLRVRAKEDVNSKVVTLINNGETVTILNVATESAYYNVKTADNKTGYCLKEYIKL